MFLISFLAVVLVTGLCLMFSGVNVVYFIDAVSMLILVIVVVPVLIQTGLLKDFNNSFRLTIGKKSKASFKEIKRAIEALKLVRKTSFYTAIFIFCVSVIIILYQLTSLELLGPNLVVASLIVIYAVFLNIIFFPMEKQLEVQLIEFDGEELIEKIEVQKQMEIQKRLKIEETLELGEKQLEKDKVEQ